MVMLAKWLVIGADMASRPEHLEAQLIRWGGLYWVAPVFYLHLIPNPIGLTSAPCWPHICPYRPHPQPLSKGRGE